MKTKGATYTGNMKSVFLKCGFENVVNKTGVVLSTGAGLKRGDILLHERNHTAMYLGDGHIVQASINEKGGITGGRVATRQAERSLSAITTTTLGMWSCATLARMPKRSRKKLRRKPWEAHPICVRFPFPFYRKEAQA